MLLFVKDVHYMLDSEQLCIFYILILIIALTKVCIILVFHTRKTSSMKLHNLTKVKWANKKKPGKTPRL